MAVRVVGPMQWIVWPSVAAAGATVLLATPVRLFGLGLPEPVLPLVLAFAWPLIRPSILAPAVLFGLGLFLDLVWAGALGLWPLGLLAVYGLILGVRAILSGQQTQFLFAWYGLSVGFAFLLAYLATTMAGSTPPGLSALLGQMVPTLLLFPLADWMIQRFDDGDLRFR